jgi:hypothetical protein
MAWEQSYNYGEAAEKRFASLLFCPVEATKEQNIFEHWDVLDGKFKYDVKAMKKFRRSDDYPTDRIHYVELKNVNGDDGWLYGKADRIAFETRRYWLIVSRLELQKAIDGMDMQKSDCPAPYKLYSRKGRSDLMTLVPTIDLLSMAEKVMEK